MTFEEPSSVEALLKKMISFDTCALVDSGDLRSEEKLRVYLEELAVAWGFRTRCLKVPGYSDNLLIQHQISETAPWILFVSHMDTVAVDGMSIDPFSAVERDRRIYGRGACDTKCTGAAMLWALKEYSENNDETAEYVSGHNVALLFSVREEVGMHGVRSFVANDLPQLEFKPVACFVGEPTLLQPVVAHNGTLRFRIHTEGKAAHSSKPADGVSAISLMTQVIAKYESDYIPSLVEEHALTGRAQSSVNTIKGGVAFNIIPESCVVEVDRRLVPSENADEVFGEIEKFFDRSFSAKQRSSIRIERAFSEPPLSEEGSGEAKKLFARAINDPHEFQGKAYGTEAGHISAAGVDAIVLGPGDIQQAHTHDEWLSIEQLQRGAKVYLEIMLA